MKDKVTTRKRECLDACKESETNYYLECIHKGWGIHPQTSAEFLTWIKKMMPDDTLQEYREVVESGELYKELIKDIFWGLVALRGIGYSVDVFHKLQFDWMEAEMPKFD